MAVLLSLNLKHVGARRPSPLRSLSTRTHLATSPWVIRILEWKASTNAWIAFGVKNGLKPRSLETIKQIFTGSKKKKIRHRARRPAGGKRCVRRNDSASGRN